MSAPDGFIDLRLNRQQGGNEESFWPSFTDIMTVVLMIFMIAMVVLLVRNMDLVRQVRATMEAERQAAALAQATSQEKDSLAVKLMETENELSMLRMQLMQFEREKASLTTRLDERQRELMAVKVERQRLNEELASLAALRDELRQELRDLNLRLASSQAENTSLQTRQAATVEELETLKRTHSLKEQELVLSRSELQSARELLAKAEGQYSDLKVKYDRLVRPARTAQGKYVIDVRYYKSGGQEQISYRRPADDQETTTSYAQLTKILDRAKQQHPKDLYVKIIIPQDSGLSYAEAWKFTSDMLKRYDYYYQDVQSGDVAVAP